MRGPWTVVLPILLVAGRAHADDDPARGREPDDAPARAPLPPLPPPAEGVAKPSPEPVTPEPAPTPDASAQASSGSPAPVAPTRRFFFSIAAAYSRQSLYSTPIGGADIEAALGDDFGGFAVAALVDLVPGSTAEGLPTMTGRVGPLIEAHLNRLHLGGGGRIGTFNVSRVTENDNLFSLSLGLFARLSFDILRLDDEGKDAFFLGGKAGIDWVGTSLWDASLGGGVRF